MFVPRSDLTDFKTRVLFSIMKHPKNPRTEHFDGIDCALLRESLGMVSALYGTMNENPSPTDYLTFVAIDEQFYLCQSGDEIITTVRLFEERQSLRIVVAKADHANPADCDCPACTQLRDSDVRRC